MNTTLYIIRHGQTARNRAGALQGRSDFPLNAEGEQQAAAVRDKLRGSGLVFSAVYSSPLQRALQTAHIIAPEVPAVIDERLIEMDYGPYEGLDLAHMPEEVLTFFKDFVHNPAPAGMEQLSMVVARLSSFLADLSKQGPCGNILISTHAIAMKGALEALTPDSNGSYWSKYIGNCEVYRTELADGLFSVPVKVEL